MGNACGCNEKNLNIDGESIDQLHIQHRLASGNPKLHSIIETSPNAQAQLNSEMSARKQLRDFEIIQKIGQGAFGHVFLVKQKSTKKFFAMKQMYKQEDMTEKQAQYALNERQILASNDHPFLLKLYYAFQDTTSLYLITEYAEGSDMQLQLKYKSPLKDSEICFYMAEMIVALEYLHDRGIIYRDLKPENILITRDGHIKLADFGLSKILSGEVQRSNSGCGTIGYIAPEILAGEDGYDTQADLWSLGTTLYELYHGRPPFYSRNKREMIESALTKDVLINPKINQNAQDLIRQLLNPKPSERITLEELKSHKMFSSVNWERIKKLEEEAPKPIRMETVEKELQKFNVRNSTGKSMTTTTKGISPNKQLKSIGVPSVITGRTTATTARQDNSQQTDIYTQDTLDAFRSATFHVEGYSYNFNNQNIATAIGSERSKSDAASQIVKN